MEQRAPCGYGGQGQSLGGYEDELLEELDDELLDDDELDELGELLDEDELDELLDEDEELREEDELLDEDEITDEEEEIMIDEDELLEEEELLDEEELPEEEELLDEESGELEDGMISPVKVKDFLTATWTGSDECAVSPPVWQ